MKQILQRCSFRRLLSLMFLLAMVGNAWGDDETLTISGASSGNNAPWGTSYGDGSGTSTTSASTSIGISYTQVARMSTAIQIAKNTSSGFYSTTVPSNKVIKSVAITSKTNSVNLHVSTDGTNWTSADEISSTTTRSYTVNQAYKYFKVTATSKYAQITKILVTYMSDGSDKTALSTPTNVSSSNVTDKSAELSWDAVSGASNYTVQYKEHSADNWVTVSPDPTSTSCTLSDLEYATEYDYNICANPTNTTTYKSSVFASGTFTTLDFINAAGTYNIIPNNTFWDCSTQDGAKSITANTVFGPTTRYGISVSMNSGTSAYSYMKSDHSRAYEGYSVTIDAPAGFNLTNIVFTGSTWVAPTASVGTMNSKTWTGSASSVTFTFSGTSYMSNIAVTYAADKVLQSVAVSGTPTNTTYEAGDSFDPTGLTVTGTYDDNSTETFSSGITWSTPAALTAGQTSVDITATVNGITSPSFTVTGLTVTAKDTRTTPTITMADINLEVGENETLSATSSANLPVTYTIKSGSDKVSLENGVLTATAVGSAVITASTAETAEYKAASKDVNVTVIAAVAKGISALRSQITSTDSKNPTTGISAKLTNAVVTYVSSGTTPNIYIEDATGGINVYAKNTGLAAGDVINGVVTGSGCIYNGLTEMTAIDLSAATKTTTTEIPCTDVTLAELNSNMDTYESRRVRVTTATVTSAMSSRSATISQNGSTVTVREGVSGCTGEVLSTVDEVISTIVGYPQDYNTTKQLVVYSTDDITMAGKANTTVVFNCADGIGTAENPVAFTIGEENTFPTAVVKDENGDAVEGAVVEYSSTNSSYITVNSSTGALDLLKYASKSNSVKVTATYDGDATHKGGTATYYLTIAKGTPVIAFSESTLSVATDASNAGLTATATKGSNLTISYSSSNPEVASFADANSPVLTLHKAGTATITAQSVANDAWKQSEAVTYALTVTQAVAPTTITKYVLVESQNDFVDGEYVIAINDNGTYKAMASNLADGYLDAVTVSVSDNAISTLSGAAVWTVKTGVDADEYPIASFKNGTNYLSNNSGTLEYSTTEENFITYVSDGGDGTVYASDWEHWFGYADGFMMSANDANAPSLYFFKRTEYAVVTISENCYDTDEFGYKKYYATFSSDKAFDVSDAADDEIYVSEVGLNQEGTLNVLSYADAWAGTEDKTIVPANTGVLIQSSNPGTYKFTVVTGEEAESARGPLYDEENQKDGNLLRPSGAGITATAMETADANCLYYRLTMHKMSENSDERKIGFWWGAAEGAAFDLAANKAYLAVPKAASVKAQGFWFGDEATSISAPAIENNANDAIYNLNGQRVNTITKGMYIKNGKKYFVK